MLLDALGQEIRLGSYIYYAVKGSTRMHRRIAKVTCLQLHNGRRSIKVRAKSLDWDSVPVYTTTINQTQNVVIVSVPEQYKEELDQHA